MVAKGKVKDSIPKNQRQHYVDGISGATLTGRFLSEGLVETLEKFEPVSKKFRNDNLDFKLENKDKQ
jgi:Na+-transporting NADH:ubiquinone oxidoreductase subunit C